MNQRFLQNIYHTNENRGMIVRNVIQSKSGIAIYVDVSVKIGKNKICAKKIIFGILLYVVAKMVNIFQLLLMNQWLSVIKL